MDAFNGQSFGGNNTGRTVLGVGALIVLGILIVTWVNSKKAKKSVKGRDYYAPPCPLGR